MGDPGHLLIRAAALLLAVDVVTSHVFSSIYAATWRVGMTGATRQTVLSSSSTIAATVAMFLKGLLLPVKQHAPVRFVRL